MLSWLHISDFHIDSNASVAAQAAQRQELEDFLKNLAQIIRKDNLPRGINKPDVVFVTGDLAARSATADYINKTSDINYLPVLDFLGKVKDILELRPDNFYIVPGNHDVNFSGLDKNMEAGILKYIKNRDIDDLNNVLMAQSHQTTRNSILSRFSNYINFLKEFNPSLGNNVENILWRCYDPVKIDESRFAGIIGIASSWLSGSYFAAELLDTPKQNEAEDTSYLAIGHLKIKKLLEEAAGKGSNFSLVLMHHNYKETAAFEQEQVQRTFRDKCSLVLYGHAHASSADEAEFASATPFLFRAGALYTKDLHRKGKPLSFSMGSLSFEEKSRRYCIKQAVYLRHPNGKSWNRDDNYYNQEECAELHRRGYIFDKGVLTVNKYIDAPVPKGPAPAATMKTSIPGKPPAADQPGDNQTRSQGLSPCITSVSQIKGFSQCQYQMQRLTYSFTSFCKYRVGHQLGVDPDNMTTVGLPNMFLKKQEEMLRYINNEKETKVRDEMEMLPHATANHLEAMLKAIRENGILDEIKKIQGDNGTDFVTAIDSYLRMFRNWKKTWEDLERTSRPLIPEPADANDRKTAAKETADHILRQMINQLTFILNMIYSTGFLDAPLRYIVNEAEKFPHCQIALDSANNHKQKEDANAVSV